MEDFAQYAMNDAIKCKQELADLKAENITLQGEYAKVLEAREYWMGKHDTLKQLVGEYREYGRLVTVIIRCPTKEEIKNIDYYCELDDKLKQALIRERR